MNPTTQRIETSKHKYHVLLIGDSHAYHGYEWSPELADRYPQVHVYTQSVPSALAFHADRVIDAKAYTQPDSPPFTHIVFCMGEVDLRCHIPRLLGLKNKTHPQFKEKWLQILGKGSKKYVSSQEAIDQSIRPYKKAMADFIHAYERYCFSEGHLVPVFAIRSVTPPVEFFQGDARDNPVWGSVYQRSYLTTRYNQLLIQFVERNAMDYSSVLMFVDIWGSPLEKFGILEQHYSDQNVHIGGAGIALNYSILFNALGL